MYFGLLTCQHEFFELPGVEHLGDGGTSREGVGDRDHLDEAGIDAIEASLVDDELTKF